MTGLSFLIGFAQMTLVLMTAGLIARAIRRFSPRTSASVGIAGLMLSFCLLVLTVVNIRRPIETHFTTSSTVSASWLPIAPNIAVPLTGIANDSSLGSPTLAVSLREFASWLGTIQLAQPTTTPLQHTVTAFVFFSRSIVGRHFDPSFGDWFLLHAQTASRESTDS